MSKAMPNNFDLRPIRVTNTITGETREFTITRAGIIALAKFTTAYGIGQTLNDTLKLLFNELRINQLGAQIGWCQEYLEGDYVWLYHWYARLDNCHKAVDGRLYRDEDLFYIGRHYFPISWKKYLKYCSNCEEYYFDQEITPDSVLMDIPTDLIGFEECCHSCAEETYDMRQCEDCGRWFDPNSEGIWVDSDERWVCDECSDNYCQCATCGAWFNPDNSDSISCDGRNYCCEECAENDGVVWDDYEEEYTRNPRRAIGDYHDHKGHLSPLGSFRKGQKQDLYIGRETEFDGQDINDYDNDFYETLIDKFGDTTVLERDGSVAFESITCPMTPNEFFAHDWETAFKYLRDNGWRSHDTNTCGTHFHFSEGYLGFNRLERENNAKKICHFIQAFWRDIVKISRRQRFDYCENWGSTISRNTSFDYLRNDRYRAVNVQNMGRGIHTIEIRICKGTLKTETMLASADFFLHIVRNAKRISWKNIDNLKLWFKGIKNKNTINYIKARHAFEGAF